MPKNVVLDTNIYRKNPSRTDLPFQALARLCKAEVLKLHLPYIVEREFQTQRRSLYEKDLSSALSSISSLRKKELTEKSANLAKGIQEQIEASADLFLQDAEMALVDWAIALGAMRYELTADQAKRAMEAYFRGGAPLKEPKTRNDIPDAFIFQTILSLSSEAPLIVVSEDGNIAEASAQLAGTTVYKTLAEFIESEEIQAAIVDLDIKDDPGKIGALLSGYESDSEEISSAIMDKVGKKLMRRVIRSRSIPDDNNEATIVAYDTPDSIDLDFDKLAYFGDGQFGVPFEIEVDVEAYFYIFKADYFAMDKEYSVSDHNDHYFEAHDSFGLSVYGTAGLAIPLAEAKKLTAENIGQHLTIEIDSIDDVVVNDED